MPKLRVPDEELDIEELEEAEYTEGGDYEDYEGEDPPGKEYIPVYVKKIWWTYTKNDDPMLKVLGIADDTAGEYEGWPAWDNIALTASAKFRWKPFFDALGITLRDVKSKTVVGAETESNGDPIEKIGTWKPGEDQDGAYARVLTKREKYDGNWSTKIDTWLPYEPGDAADEAEPEEEEEEEEEEEAPKRSGRTGQAKASAKSSGSRSRAKPKSEPEENEDGEDEPDKKPARTRRTSRSPNGAADAGKGRGTRRAKAATAKASPAKGRGRGRASDDEADDEPPF